MPKSLIASAVDVVVYIKRKGTGRIVESVAVVEDDLENDEYRLSYVQ